MQTMLMEEIVMVMACVYRRPVTLEQAAGWRLQSWMDEHFPVSTPFRLACTWAPGICLYLCAH